MKSTCMYCQIKYLYTSGVTSDELENTEPMKCFREEIRLL